MAVGVLTALKVGDSVQVVKSPYLDARVKNVGKITAVWGPGQSGNTLYEVFFPGISWGFAFYREELAWVAAPEKGVTK